MEKIFTFSLLLLTACSGDPNNNDPMEEFNRESLELNVQIDKSILRPAAMTYKDSLHDEVENFISNVLLNLKEPFYFVNHTITLNGEGATSSLFRFVINSTIGVLGMLDIAEYMGLPRKKMTHQDTLKKIEVPTGDYLVLPILGFSSTRDAIAEPVSWFMDPVGYFIGFPYMVLKAALLAVSDRAENAQVMDSLLEDKTDLYSTTKNIYFQRYGIKKQNEDEYSDSPTPDS
ncbi:hypothetical protein FACS1894126_5070 [Alphaproteobacteria bacterium]|nr:hypothetical protein FACS1894126_5070 [Alphaproteobacteria bacterium]